MRESLTIHSSLQKTGSHDNSGYSFRVGQVLTNSQHQREWKLFITSLVCVDLIAIAAGLVLAYLIRFKFEIPLFYLETVPSLQRYLTIGAVLIPVWIIFFWIGGLYNRDNLLGGTKEYANLFNTATAAMFILIATNFLVPEIILARGWLLMTWGFVFGLTMVDRFLMRRVVYALRKQGRFLSPAIIIGSNEESLMLAEQLSNQFSSGLQIIGFISETTPVQTLMKNGRAILGKLEDLDAIVNEYEVEEIIVTNSTVSPEEMLSIFRQYGVADGINLRLSSGLYEILTTGMHVQELSGVPLIRFNKMRLTGIDLLLKYLLDYTFSLLLLPFVILMSVFIGILIKIDSPGPVFHFRKVMGVNGKPFYAFKYRTMHTNGDEILNSHPELKEELAKEHKLKYDPRITRVGQILRKFSIDEVPQVFNVLLNQMSWVGPRMISPEEMDNYKQLGMNLLTVKPGITGLWQVSGRSDVTYEERIRLDMYYIRNWSIWLDIQLLVRTIPAVLSKRGAY